EVVLQVEHARKPRAVPQRIFPRAIRTLRLDQVFDRVPDGRALGVPCGEEAQESPRRLAGQRVAATRQLRIVVRPERLAPASIRVLPAQEPFNGTLDVALRAVLADGAEPAQHRPGPVDVVRAPPAVPRAILGLRALDEIECAWHGGVIEAV